MSRLKERYQKEVAPALKKEFGYGNVMAIPRIEKVVVNMGLGEATSNAKLADVGADEIGRITGQKAVVRRATKSIAQFKLRQGMPVGAMVTCAGAGKVPRPSDPIVCRASATSAVCRRRASTARQFHHGPQDRACSRKSTT
jgi:hypothetical protein